MGVATPLPSIAPDQIDARGGVPGAHRRGTCRCRPSFGGCRRSASPKARRAPAPIDPRPPRQPRQRADPADQPAEEGASQPPRPWSAHNPSACRVPLDRGGPGQRPC